MPQQKIRGEDFRGGPQGKAIRKLVGVGMAAGTAGMTSGTPDLTTGTAGMTTETAMTTVTATNITTTTATIRSPAVTMAHMWITTTTRGANRMLVITGTNSIFGLLSMVKATDMNL